MTWNAFHNRGEILRQAMATADTRADGELPMDLDGVAECFDGELDLLAAMMLKWHTRLAGNIERALAEQPLDLEVAVIAAWLETQRQLPGVRAVIDRAATLPAETEIARLVAKAQHREWARLAIAAGLASDPGPLAAERGRDLELAARAALPARQAAARGVSERVTPTLVERIKAVLAA